MRSTTCLVGIALYVFGCGGTAQKPEARAADLAATSAREPLTKDSPSADRALDPTKAEDPKEALRRADRLSMDQLAAPERDGRFAVDRQVGALRKSIELYGQFIDHAGSDPQFQDEVRRSRERIEEAKTTITFLLSQQTSP